MLFSFFEGEGEGLGLGLLVVLFLPGVLLLLLSLFGSGLAGVVADNSLSAAIFVSDCR